MDAKGTAMATLTGSRTRTITGHLANLLEYPKWLIERDVDFTHCEFDGHYDGSVAQCADCPFSIGCKWLTTIRGMDTCDASLNELIDALRGAVSCICMRESVRNHSTCDCETCAWLGSARQLLRSISR